MCIDGDKRKEIQINIYKRSPFILVRLYIPQSVFRIRLAESNKHDIFDDPIAILSLSLSRPHCNKKIYCTTKG